MGKRAKRTVPLSCLKPFGVSHCPGDKDQDSPIACKTPLTCHLLPHQPHVTPPPPGSLGSHTGGWAGEQSLSGLCSCCLDRSWPGGLSNSGARGCLRLSQQSPPRLPPTQQRVGDVPMTLWPTADHHLPLHSGMFSEAGAMTFGSSLLPSIRSTLGT